MNEVVTKKRTSPGQSIQPRLCLGILSMLAMSVPMVADVKLPAILSDHMVLMRSDDVPVWGWADPGETVTVKLDTTTGQATAGSDGRWLLKLDLANLGPGPYAMTVTGKNKITVNDVLVGAVWLASGQSNMELPLKSTINGPAVAAQSANDQLRVFRVKKVMKDLPAEDCQGKWVSAGPQISGDFSAIAYYFSKKLQETEHIPVGLIDTSWGGTFSELWLSHDAILSVDAFREGEAARQKIIPQHEAEKKAFVPNYAAWLQANHRVDTPSADISALTGELTSTNGWHKVALPGPIADGPGVYWIRKEIDITPEAATANLEFKVSIGPIEGFEQAYWNGTKVEETTYQNYPGDGYSRYFPIPTSLIKDGKNILALRIFSPGEPPKLFAVAKNFWAGPISLAGDWLVHTEYKLPSLNPAELAQIPKAPNHSVPLSASTIFNGEINPLVHEAMSGVIWYQGESNTNRAYQYRVAFPLLIQDWRNKWDKPNLPFFFFQLPAYGDKQTKPKESDWAELRESQGTALKLPNTAEAVLIDLGESDNIHYRDKRAPGERMAQIAETEIYGKKTPDQSPTYASMDVQENKVQIRFAHVNGTLSAHVLSATYDVNTALNKTAPLIPNSPSSELQGFAICGADHRWVWANAKIEGKDTVIVWSDDVPHPIAVRYAWDDNPTVNLYDAYGLPAAPFRTDSLPLRTQKTLFGPGS